MPMTISASNADILNAIRANASLDYKDRIPAATRANLPKVLANLQSYQPLWNEFQNLLLGRIGLTLFNENEFSNRLKPLKMGMMRYGSMIQEIGANLLKAEEYDPNATNVFEQNVPDINVAYYTVNRRNVYEMTLNEELLREAFLNDGQLGAYMNNMLSLPMQSAEWDEYLLMKGLIKNAHDEWGDMPNIQVPDLASSANIEADAKTLTERIRATYLKLKGFYNTQYNPAGMDVTSRELVLLTTPEVMARQDVFNLASAFNMDKAEWVADRVIVVDDFDISGAQAMLIDADAYRVADRVPAKMTSIYNPKADCWNYFLHVQQILGLSRMRNMCLFSTETDTITAGSPRTVASVTVADVSAYTLEPGAEIPLTPTVTYSDSSTDGAAYFIITAVTNEAPAASGDDAGIPTVIYPDSGTYVDRLGVLHVADVSTYSSITVTAYAAADNSKFASVTLEVESDDDGE